MLNNSHSNLFASSFGNEDITFHDIKGQQQQHTQSDVKSAKFNNKNTTPGSCAANGVYVDMGKVLLEAAKTGDSGKVQECIKNGAPFITDWVS
jgi:hypothetical protein